MCSELPETHPFTLGSDEDQIAKLGDNNVTKRLQDSSIPDYSVLVTDGHDKTINSQRKVDDH